MTIRQHLQRKYRKIFVIALSAWLVAAVGMATQKVWLIVPAFACFFASIIYTLYSIRCPRCAANLCSIAAHQGGWGLGRQARFCPFCAADLDTEINDIP